MDLNKKIEKTVSNVISFILGGFAKIIIEYLIGVFITFNWKWPIDTIIGRLIFLVLIIAECYISYRTFKKHFKNE